MRPIITTLGIVDVEALNRFLKVLEYFPELDGRHHTLLHDPDLVPLGTYDPLNRMVIYRENLPTYQTLGHEVMHAVQHQDHDLPATDRATDLFTFARGELFTDDPGSYLEIPGRSKWALEEDRSEFDRIRGHLHPLAVQALQERENGNRRYIQWFENQLKIILEEDE